MRKLIGLGVVFGSAVAVWACSSSSSTAPSGGNDTDSGNSSSGSSSGSGSDSSSPEDASASCSKSEVASLTASYGFDGGAGDGAVPPCVMTKCSTELNDCSTESCQACGTALASCVISNCTGFADASIIVSDGAAKGTCDAPGPECSALGKCCSEISTGGQIFQNATLTQLGTQCTANSVGCDESVCAQTITEVNSAGSAIGQSNLCPGP